MVQTKPKRLRLFVIEEEEIYKHVYELIPSISSVDLLGISDYSELVTLKHTISTCQPDVLLVGVKKLENDIIEVLSQIREDNGKIAVVLLSKSYAPKDTEKLREIAAKGKGGMAVFLKQSLDQLEQLLAIINTAGFGQVVLDPVVAGVMLATKVQSNFLDQLTPRELEGLGLLANGYTNLAIAEAMYIDVKTVERHLNNIYSKLREIDGFSHKHPRVAATIYYLQQVAARTA